MLKARLVTAGLLAPIVLLATLLLPAVAMATILGAFLALAAWEWARLAGWHSGATRAAYGVLITGLAAGIYRFGGEPAMAFVISGIACAGWCAAAVWIVAYQRGRAALPGGAGITALIGMLILLCAWTAVVALLSADRILLIVLFVLIWSADAAAYFAGKRWGQRRLATRISPGKTWVGLFAGVFSAVPVALVVALALGWSVRSGIVFCLVAVLSVALSVVGDLVESIYKRQQGMKDSGGLLPGHGGVLDRIDSFLAAAPLFFFGVNLMQQ